MAHYWRLDWCFDWRFDWCFDWRLDWRLDWRVQVAGRTVGLDGRQAVADEPARGAAANSAAVILRALLVLGATALAARIHVPLAETVAPFTLQTLAVLLAAPLAGLAAGSLGMALYLLVGGLGLPVFSGGGAGWAALTGPTGGFLWAFLVVVPLMGLVHRRLAGASTSVWLGIFALGHLLILVLGYGWLLARGLVPDLPASVMPLLPGLVLKTMLATGILHFAAPTLGGDDSPARDRR
mgnify:CR=1 FL=1